MLAARPRFISGLLMCLLAAVAGCARETGKYRTVPVSGVLTCQGKPVAGVQILFEPQPDPSQGREEGSPGKAATAVSDAEGKFILSTYGFNDGAIPGKHKVSVLVIDDPMHPVPPESKKAIAPCLKETREIEITPEMAEVKLSLGE